MSYADIVLDASPRRDIAPLIEAAASLALAFGSRLSVVAAAWPKVSLIREAFSASTFSASAQVRQCEEALTTTRSIGDRVLAERGLQPTWCCEVAEPTAILVDHLLTADLAITAAGDHEGFAAVDACHLAARSGAPVLRLGSPSSALSFDRVVVAWKDGLEARRAVHEALPILRRAQHVLVLGVGDEVHSDGLDALTQHLQRHRVQAQARHVSDGGQGVSAEILRHAEAEACGLIVSGAYSRSRLKEMILGGVTRDLQHTPEIAWFLAH